MDYVAEILFGTTNALLLPGLSPNVDYALEPIRGLALLDSLSGISDDPVNPDYDALISAEPGLASGAECLGCFDELFEKIIVSPRMRDCGYVLADVEWQTNIWNTHRNTDRSLISADVLDSGNVQVDNPAGYPIHLSPLEGCDLTTIVPKDGDATIRAVVTFVVTGESGTDLLVVGSRVIVFPAEPDWSEPLKERTQYLTSILNAYTDAEQRIALRKNPRTHISYRVMSTERKETAALEALLYGAQARTFGVPFWPDAQPIAQSIAIYTSVIHCDTANRKFSPGGIVLLWRSIFDNEAATILSVAADSITVSAPLNSGWAADGRTYAIPVLTGRWDAAARLGHISPIASELDAAFQCEPAADVPSADPDLQYGYDVLDLAPNADQDCATQYSRTVQIIDYNTGKSKSIDHSGVALSRLSGFLWTLSGRSEIAAYRAWAALRKGRQKAFWAPTWRHDIVQREDLAAGGINLVIEKTGYARYQYEHAARRYLCFAKLDGSGDRCYRKVTAVYDGDSEDTLVLDAALSETQSIAAGSCMISFLRLVRLAADDPELTWHSRDVAEASLEFQELPLEVTP